MKLLKTLSILLLICIIIVAGAWREILFINVNAQIYFLNGQLSNSGLVSALSFLSEWNTVELGKLKWALTIGFTMLFLGLSLLVLWILHRDKKKLFWLIIIYTSIFILSGIFLVLGSKLGYSEFGYTMSRKFMGALQSPFPLMLLIPSFYLIDHFGD